MGRVGRLVGEGCFPDGQGPQTLHCQQLWKASTTCCVRALHGLPLSSPASGEPPQVAQQPAHHGAGAAGLPPARAAAAAAAGRLLWVLLLGGRRHGAAARGALCGLGSQRQVAPEGGSLRSCPEQCLHRVGPPPPLAPNHPPTLTRCISQHAAALAAAAAGGVPALDDEAFAAKQALCRRQLAVLSDLQQLALPGA